MSKVKKVVPINTKTRKKEDEQKKLEEALQLTQKFKQDREHAAGQKFQQAVQEIEKEFGVKFSYAPMVTAL
jgi:hypothetical protein